VLGILGLLAIPATLLTIHLRSREPLFTPAAEEYREGSKAPIDPAQDGPRIERLFAALAAASKDGNEEAFEACFHPRRMLAEIEQQGALKTVGMRRDELDLEGELEAALRNWCDQLKNSFSAWQSVKRCTYRFLEGRGEAEAVVVMRGANRLSSFRFWVIKEKDTWSIFDYEPLKGGSRMSAYNSKLLAWQSKGDLEPHHVERCFELLDKARNLLARDMTQEALEALAQAEPISGSGKGLYPSVLFLRAQALLQAKRPKEALAAIDESLRSRPDAPRTRYLRGVILLRLGQYQDSIREEEEYLRIVEEDSDAYAAIGAAYEGLGKPDRAREAYRKGAACEEFSSENQLKLKKLDESDR
jgi:tetratricopeptide (TPR) repeat protein